MCLGVLYSICGKKQKTDSKVTFLGAFTKLHEEIKRNERTGMSLTENDTKLRDAKQLHSTFFFLGQFTDTEIHRFYGNQSSEQP